MAYDGPPKLTYQVSPIFLTGGAIAQVPGGVLPLMWLTQRQGDPAHAYNVNVGNLPPLPIIDLDDAFGAFTVLPTGSLVKQTVATYPFANQFTAANATIKEPIDVSLLMDAPMRGPNAWANKFAIMTALKATLETHNNNGGTYTVMTPAFMYIDMILLDVSDASRSSANSALPQNAWKFSFTKPLITQTDLQAAYDLNMKMWKLSNGLPTIAQLTGLQVGTLVGLASLLPPALASVAMGGMLTSSNLGFPGSVPALNAPTGAISSSIATPASPQAAAASFQVISNQS
jgi:hypothetical protein